MNPAHLHLILSPFPAVGLAWLLLSMSENLTTKRTKVTKEVTTLAWPPSFVVFATFVVMLPAVHGLHT